MKRFIQSILIALVCYYIFLYGKNFSFSDNNTLPQQNEIKITEETKPAKAIEKPAKNNNTDFENQVSKNRSILDEKFPGNYIDRTLKSGELVRWNPSTFPLYVYVEYNPDLPEYFDTTIKKAFSEWQRVSENFITFNFTETEENADIKCYFPKDYRSENDGQRMIAGVTNFKYENDKLKYAQINFASYDMFNKYRTKDAVYSTALHEIGHALGISGHSINKEDIMYPVSKHGKAQISKSDINTLKLIYSIVPDVTNKEYSEKDKNTYITTEDVLGTYDARLDLELEATKADVNADKNSYYAGKYFNMGNIYYKKRDYQNAIKNYKKGLTMTSDPKDSEVVNMNIAICYNELKDYEKALKHIKISNIIKKTPEKSALLANLYYQTGNLEKAKNLSLKILSKNPDNYNSYITLYHIYRQENNDEKIYKLYEKGMKYFPDNPPIMINKN